MFRFHVVINHFIFISTEKPFIIFICKDKPYKYQHAGWRMNMYNQVSTKLKFEVDIGRNFAIENSTELWGICVLKCNKWEGQSCKAD